MHDDRCDACSPFARHQCRSGAADRHGGLRRHRGRPEPARHDLCAGAEPVAGGDNAASSILAANPWIARNLYNAFDESKRRSLERLYDPAVSRYPLPWLPTYARRMRDLFGGDPFPFGIEENRPMLETFLAYCHQQGIAHRHAKPEEIFPAGIMAPVKV